jgi:hypothetical protein
MSQEPRATVREVDGRLVLDDPDAVAMIRAVEKHNCRLTAEAVADRIRHFEARIAEKGLSTKDVVITLISADDPHGRPMAEALMPGHDWQTYRDRGEVPFARGLAGREGIQEMIELFDPEAAEKLSRIDGAAVVVVDRGVAEAFPASEFK